MNYSDTLSKLINATIEDLFEKTKLTFLGPKYAKKFVFSYKTFDPSTTIQSIYTNSAMAHSPDGDLDQAMIKKVADNAENYIDKLKEATTSDIMRITGDILSNVNVQSKIRNISTREYFASDDGQALLKDLYYKIDDIKKKTATSLERIVSTETMSAQNMGAVDGILGAAKAIGIRDPIIYKLTYDHPTRCHNCEKLHLLPDMITPKVYKLSEVAASTDFKHPVMSISPPHPNCFTGTQMLATDKGLFSLKELFDSQTQPNVLVDFRIKNRMKLNGKDINIIPGNVVFDSHSTIQSRFFPATNVYDTGIQNVLRITLNNGYKIEVTEDHDMWTEIGNTRWAKRKAKTLKVDDKVPIISKCESFGTDHFPLEAELMGNLMGDGCIVGNNASWRFFGNDIPYGEVLYQKMIAKYCNVRQICKQRAFLRIYPPNNKYKVSSCSFKSEVVGKIFREQFGLSKKPRRMPVRLFKADKETVSSFLKGLYAADGHSELNTAVLVQNDLFFLQEIQLLLSMFGFTSYIYDCKNSENSIITYADGRKFNTKRKKAYKLVIRGYEQYIKFITEIGFGVPIKQERAINNIKKEIMLRGNWITSRITKIEHIGPQQTYCLTEPMTNTVTVNGIVTGQCYCAISSLLPGYGFENGKITYKGKNEDGIHWNEWSFQRNGSGWSE